MEASSLRHRRTTKRLRYPHRTNIKKVPDILISDIRDEQTLSNTQRENWLLPTEPMQGAPPRQTGRERPPVIDNPALRDAAGNTAVLNPCRTFLLSPGQWISREEEVFTPLRGGGGRPVPEPQGVPREVRAVPKPFPDGFQEDKLRDGGQNIGSPVDMLVDTVTRCTNFNEGFLQPGWRTEKTPGGFVMIPPRGTMDRRRAENDG